MSQKRMRHRVELGESCRMEKEIYMTFYNLKDLRFKMV
jgi:hypothetical protein